MNIPLPGPIAFAAIVAVFIFYQNMNRRKQKREERKEERERRTQELIDNLSRNKKKG